MIVGRLSYAEDVSIVRIDTNLAMVRMKNKKNQIAKQKPRSFIKLFIVLFYVERIFFSLFFFWFSVIFAMYVDFLCLSVSMAVKKWIPSPKKIHSHKFTINTFVTIIFFFFFGLHHQKISFLPSFLISCSFFSSCLFFLPNSIVNYRWLYEKRRSVVQLIVFNFIYEFFVQWFNFNIRVSIFIKINTRTT